MEGIDRSKLEKDLQERYDKIEKAISLPAYKEKGEKALKLFKKYLEQQNHPSVKKPTQKKPQKKKPTKKLPKKRTRKGRTWTQDVKRIQDEFKISWEDAKKIYKKRKPETKNKGRETVKELIDRFKKQFKVQPPNSSRDLGKDAKIKAKPSGRRISKGKGSNQHGKSKKGNVYYEYRMNRADDSQVPEYLEKGGDIDELKGLSIYFDEDRTYKDEIRELLRDKWYMNNNDYLNDYGNSFIVYSDDINPRYVRDVYDSITRNGYDSDVKLELFGKGGDIEFAKGGGVDEELLRESAKNIYERSGNDIMKLRRTFLQLANTDEKSGDLESAKLRRKIVSEYQSKEPKIMAKGGYVLFADIKGEGTADVEFFDSKEKAEKRKKEYESGQIKDVDTALGNIPVNEITNFYIEKEKFAKGGEVSDDEYADYLNEAMSYLDYEDEEYIIGGENRANEYFGRYGDALREYDPIAFEVGRADYERERNFAKGGDIKTGDFVFFDNVGDDNSTKRLKVKSILPSKDGKTHHYITNEGIFSKSDIVGFEKGGKMSKNKYMIHIYHGGEQPNETKFAKTLEEAEKIGSRGEHSEIIELKKMAKGGEIININPKNFTLNQIEDLVPDIIITSIQKGRHFDDEELREQIYPKSPSSIAKWRNKNLTISDYGIFDISKGSENLYFDMTVYLADDRNDEQAYTIQLYTKENVKGMKNLISTFVQKMAKGGKIKFDPFKNAPVTYILKDEQGKEVLRTKSLNKASDESIIRGKKTSILAIDSKGNTKKLEKGGPLDDLNDQLNTSTYEGESLPISVGVSSMAKGGEVEFSKGGEFMKPDNTDQLYDRYYFSYPFGTDAVAYILFDYTKDDNVVANAIRNNQNLLDKVEDIVLEYKDDLYRNMEYIDEEIEELLEDEEFAKGGKIKSKYKVGDFIKAKTKRDGIKEGLKISKVFKYSDGKYYYDTADGYYDIPEKDIIEKIKYAKGGEIEYKGDKYKKALENDDFIYYSDEFDERFIMIRKSDGSVASDNYLAENDFFERMVEIANDRESYIYMHPAFKDYLSEYKEYEKGGEIKVGDRVKTIFNKQGKVVKIIKADFDDVNFRKGQNKYVVESRSGKPIGHFQDYELKKFAKGGDVEFGQGGMFGLGTDMMSKANLDADSVYDFMYDKLEEGKRFESSEEVFDAINERYATGRVYNYSKKSVEAGYNAFKEDNYAKGGEIIEIEKINEIKKKYPNLEPTLAQMDKKLHISIVSSNKAELDKVNKEFFRGNAIFEPYGSMFNLLSPEVFAKGGEIFTTQEMDDLNGTLAIDSINTILDKFEKEIKNYGIRVETSPLSNGEIKEISTNSQIKTPQKDALKHIQSFLNDLDIRTSLEYKGKGITRRPYLKLDSNELVEFSSNYSKGGEMTMEHGGEIDYFEEYEKLPPEARVIVEKYADRFDSGDYDYNTSREFLQEMEKQGFTFDYGLDNEPYNLRKMKHGGNLKKKNNCVNCGQSYEGFGVGDGYCSVECLT